MDSLGNGFSQGNLYIPCSKVVSRHNLFTRILAPGIETENNVYNEVWSYFKL